MLKKLNRTIYAVGMNISRDVLVKLQGFSITTAINEIDPDVLFTL